MAANPSGLPVRLYESNELNIAPVIANRVHFQCELHSGQA